jgi:hypothetical protein
VYIQVADGTEGGTSETWSWTSTGNAVAYAFSLQNADNTLSNWTSQTDVGTNVNAHIINDAIDNTPGAGSAFFYMSGYNKTNTQSVANPAEGYAIIGSVNSDNGTSATRSAGLTWMATGLESASSAFDDGLEVTLAAFSEYAGAGVLIPSAGAASSPPNTPTITDPTANDTVSSPVSITITYSDPDSDPLAKVSIRREVIT